MSFQTAPRPSDKPPDMELVERVRAGDASAMEALMRRHNRMLFRTARAILRDDAEAEDAVQDAYIAAHRALGAFRGEAKLSTWLVRIAANEALMRRRRNARSAAVLPLDASPDGERQAMQIASEERGPEEEAVRAQLRRVLETRIDALPDSYREVFVLRGVEELSVEETAAALGIPEPTVRTRFFRARSLMREALAREIDLTLEDAFGFDGARCDRLVRRVLEALRLPAGS
jgi:RNA polymerase sigma-70 factor (ECF subfamily)